MQSHAKDTMDARSYKDIRARSGNTYHTFVAPPRDASKPTLLFVHGFPSTAHDWRHQVAFFLRAGYGVVAPDLLGHGGSDKPAHLKYYAPSSICADLVDILGQAKVGRAVAVGHDWCVPLRAALRWGTDGLAGALSLPRAWRRTTGSGSPGSRSCRAGTTPRSPASR